MPCPRCVTAARPPAAADNTLVDAVSCTIAPNDWPLLDWRHVVVTNSYGREIQAQYAQLPGHDSFSGEAARGGTGPAACGHRCARGLGSTRGAARTPRVSWTRR